MNYRHVFHAGGFADVFKHTILLYILDYLQKKDKPFLAMDTHAGLGIYDLASEQADKTKEYEAGIGKILQDNDPPSFISPYLQLVRNLNSQTIRYYPGSPFLIAAKLRPSDRLVANELHPEDSQALAQNLRSFARVRIEQRDGYELLKALLPPRERRGVVLIDPPFEARDELSQMVKGIRQGLRRWPQGVYLLWYPIKDPIPVNIFQGQIAQLCDDVLSVDFFLHPPENPERLNGCGMLILNPPWTLQEVLETNIMPYLSHILFPHTATFKVTSTKA